MLQDFIIKEIKNLKCYDSEDNEVKCFVNVGNITISNIKGIVTTLEFSDRRTKNTYDGRELEMDGTIYRIVGDALLEDINSKESYEGKFKASNAILVREVGMMVTLNLLKTKYHPPYTIEIIKDLPTENLFKKENKQEKKIIINKIPTDRNGEVTLEQSEIQEIHNLLQKFLGDRYKIISTPTDIKFL